MSESNPEGGVALTDTSGQPKIGLVCPKCDKEYASRGGILRHIQECKPNMAPECPTCGKLFRCEIGLDKHHAIQHGESLKHSKYNCDYCGDTFERLDWLLNVSERNFCDMECRHNFRRTAIDVECEYCGDTVTKARVKYEESKRHFCDSACYGKWRSDNLSGSNSHLYREDLREMRTCEWCGTEFEHQINTNVGRFCSRECANEHHRGERHPCWKGGAPTFYGDNWHRQRQAAYERDGRVCQICGVEDGDNTILEVHHIRPIRWFKIHYPDPEWWQKANVLDNLITLCRPHHNEWEGVPLRPQTDPKHKDP